MRVKGVDRLFAYTLRRLLQMIPALIGIVVITFILSRVLPGDPAIVMAGEQATDDVIAKIRMDMGLDKPLFVQFFSYVGQLLQGNLGFAYHTGHTVLSDFATRFPATIELTLASVIIAICVAIPVGIIAATRKESFIDHISRVFSLIGACVPIFWLGLLFIYIFYSILGWAPAPMGRISGDLNPPTHITGLYVVDSLMTGDMVALKSSLAHLLLPAICLSTGTMAIVARMTRSSMLEVIGQDYVRTARAKGLSETAVVGKHSLINALIPTLTVLGLQFGGLLGGAVITETIFSWPGVGGYVTDSILAADYAPIQAFTLVSAILFSFINLAVDLVYGLIDPRIRYEQGRRERRSTAVSTAAPTSMGTKPAPAVVPKPKTFLRLLLRNRLAAIGLAFIVMWTVIAAIAPWIAPYDPYVTNTAVKLESPSGGHWFGTDNYGRDILSRVLYGARISIWTGLIAVSISFVIGVPLGGIAAYYGGRTGNIIMRVMDVLLAFPSLVLSMAIAASIGNGLTSAMIAVGIVGIPEFARLMYGQTVSLREKEYVEASRAIGVRDRVILFRHILPNALAPLLVQATLGMGFAILTASSLSFLGLGVKPPTAEWGAMISEGREYIISGQWWLVTFPGLAIATSILGFNLLGDGFRDVLDPRLRSGKQRQVITDLYRTDSQIAGWWNRLAGNALDLWHARFHHRQKAE